MSAAQDLAKGRHSRVRSGGYLEPVLAVHRVEVTIASKPLFSILDHRAEFQTPEWLSAETNTCVIEKNRPRGRQLNTESDQKDHWTQQKQRTGRDQDVE